MTADRQLLLPSIHPALKPLAVGLTTLGLMTGALAAPKLVSGPMAGPPELRGIALWAQADGAGEARIEYWPVDDTASAATPGVSSPPQQSARVRLEPREQFVARWRLTDLAPGTRYAYRVLVDGQSAGEVLHFRTQALWQWRRPAPDFTVVAGSCSYVNEPEVDRPGRPYGDRHDIFDRVAGENAELMLWLGDNLYYREVDFDSPEGMARRWAYERRQPHLQKLLRTGSHVSIWDDHDYGPNDANRSFVLKDHALDLVKRYWLNPSYGLPETPGAFSKVSFNDVDIFLMDNRWYRDDGDLPAPDRAMYGPAQMRWLKNALLSSTARFKIVAGGSQMLHKSPRGDSWVDYPAERDDFLKFLADTQVAGVFMMSGDVHRSELTRIERPGLYPLHDLTCSSLTSGVYVDEALRSRPNLVPGTVVMGMRNYCRLRFEGGQADRQMVISVVNADGQTQWTQRIRADELGVERKAPRPPAPQSMP